MTDNFAAKVRAEEYTLVNALKVAAEVYARDAANLRKEPHCVAGGKLDSMAKQFETQAKHATELADWIAENA